MSWRYFPSRGQALVDAVAHGEYEWDMDMVFHIDPDGLEQLVNAGIVRGHISYNLCLRIAGVPEFYRPYMDKLLDPWHRAYLIEHGHLRLVPNK